MKTENLQKNAGPFRLWKKITYQFRVIAFVIGAIIVTPMVATPAEPVAINPSVTALAASPDGTLLVCACNGKNGANQAWIEPDDSLLAIDVAGGRKIWSGKGGRGDFQAPSFAGDGRTVAVVQGRVVALVEATSGRMLHTLEHTKYPSGPLSTALSRDGKLCAVGYAPNNVGIWDVVSGECLRLLGARSNWVVALAFSPDRSQLATC
jgi:WD40 repeat protein